MWQQILITALAAGILSAIWHGVKWLLAKSSHDEVMSGIQVGRKAFFNRFGTNSSLTDEVMYKAITSSQVNIAVAKAGVLEAERQSRQRRRELGITGKELDEATVNNQVIKFCQIANEYTDVPDVLALEKTWENLQNLLLEPLYSQIYPDQRGIMTAYQEWKDCLEFLHGLIEKPKFAYLLGALEVASQEFILQICVRADQTSDVALQDLWIAILNKVKTQTTVEETKARLRAWF